MQLGPATLKHLVPACGFVYPCRVQQTIAYSWRRVACPGPERPAMTGTAAVSRFWGQRAVSRRINARLHAPVAAERFVAAVAVKHTHAAAQAGKQ